MNILDWLLVALGAAYAFSGYRQGFVVGALSTLGLVAGGVAGVIGTPALLERFEPSLGVSAAALLLVVFTALLGQAFGAYLGVSVRKRITWKPATALDALAGAGLSVAAALLVAWALGVAVSGAGLAALTTQVRSSTVLSSVDRALPGQADRLLGAFSAVADSSIFPRYLEPFVAERIRPVPRPAPAVLRDPDVGAAGRSVVRVLGTSDACDRSVAGSGFVYAPERVMTNAHVVSGVDEPVVELAGREYAAVPVSYDAALDIAVLAVDGLPARALSFDPNGDAGDSAAVLGFPENGPFHTSPARIRDEQRLRSPDIYGSGVVTRDVFSLFVDVRPGNSGGPLVSRAGAVLGVVFAASVTDPDTGYAVTSQAVAASASAGRLATEAVDTGDCS